MCGIIGYVGTDEAVPKVTEGLSVLEYRGYDSAGIAGEDGKEIRIVKCKGRITDLKEKLKESEWNTCHCAIGHTRWATHGGPSSVNAHPHRVGRVVLVHNGIIENYKELKETLLKKQVTFLSETDTEVATAVLNECYDETQDPISAIRILLKQIKGSYAFGILFTDHPGAIYAVRCGSPLVLAKGIDGNYLASDMTAILPFSKTYCLLQENEIAVLQKDSVKIYGDTVFQPNWKITNMTPESAQKGGYAHFMLKEIFEQPEAIIKSVSTRINKDGLPDFSGDKITLAFWQSVKAIQIVACGSAYHAGLMGASFLENLAKIPTTVHVASEYRYQPPMAIEGTLVIIISQSGETADSIAALRYAKSQGLSTLGIVNAVETTIARESDKCIYTYAGPEIAVATTKGYCTQVSVLYLIASAIALSCGNITKNQAYCIAESIKKDAPSAVREILNQREIFVKIAKRIYQKEHVFYIGRGKDFAMSMEAALKLKEISYIHCEAYAAGELKHGTISLVEKGTPVIAISTNPLLFEKTDSNIREVVSRGADVTVLCHQDAFEQDINGIQIVKLPSNSESALLFASLAAVQLIGYETAVLRGCDIDRPRNLAKSVTVE